MLPTNGWAQRPPQPTRSISVSPQPGDKLHSQMESALADIEDARPMPVIMNPEDARLVRSAMATW